MPPMLNKIDVVLVTALSQIHFLTLREKIILLKNIDSANGIALLSINAIAELIGRMPKTTFWNGEKVLHDAQAAATILEKREINWISFLDESYPTLLREIPDAPFALFYRGDISVLQNQCVSVVGTRNLTAEGSKAAFDFGYAAAMNGDTVVSGLAYGADGKAHSGAVDAFFDAGKGKTVAVLPCGIDTVVPSAHKKLALRILETGGCLLSEYPPLTESMAWRFVHRNRIIAGLSPATVVVQAPPGSGALLTVDFALGYNRDVMFHECTFCDSAKKVSESTKAQLVVKVKNGEKNKHKLLNTSEKYVQDGASVIKDYIDYKTCLQEVPGVRSLGAKSENDKLKDCQLPLF